MYRNKLGYLKINNYIAIVLLLVLIYLAVFYYKNIFLKEKFDDQCSETTFQNSQGLCRPVSERIPTQNNTCPPGYLIDSYKKWCWLIIES